LFANHERKILSANKVIFLSQRQWHNGRTIHSWTYVWGFESSCRWHPEGENTKNIFSNFSSFYTGDYLLHNLLITGVQVSLEFFLSPRHSNNDTKHDDTQNYNKNATFSMTTHKAECHYAQYRNVIFKGRFTIFNKSILNYHYLTCTQFFMLIWT